MEPLTPAEVRVLGCLAEKQLATPQSYPLTEHALVAACNQTTNRDPVVAYDQSVVRPALISLREQGLAKRIRREGERVEKHAHRLAETLGVEPGPLALLTVLLLRGPQTPGALKARSERLHAFADAKALDAALADLADRGLAERLSPRPGEKQARWRHLLTDDEPAAEAAAAPATEEARPRAPVPTLRELAAEIADLRARLAAVERELGLAPAETTQAAGAAPILDPDADDEGPGP